MLFKPSFKVTDNDFNLLLSVAVNSTWISGSTAILVVSFAIGSTIDKNGFSVSISEVFFLQEVRLIIDVEMIIMNINLKNDFMYLCF
jgi:hypothetical protein